MDKINKVEVSARLKEIGSGGAQAPRLVEPEGSRPSATVMIESDDEAALLKQWLKLNTEEADLKRAIREAEAALDQLAYDKYRQLTEAEIQTLVVDDKWLTTLAAAVQGELDRVSQTLTSRIRLLADRYAAPLPSLTEQVESLSARVVGHLKKMGFSS